MGPTTRPGFMTMPNTHTHNNDADFDDDDADDDDYNDEGMNYGGPISSHLISFPLLLANAQMVKCSNIGFMAY